MDPKKFGNLALWLIGILIFISGVLTLVYRNGIFYVPNGHYVVKDFGNNQLSSTERKTFWFNPFTTRIHLFSKEYRFKTEDIILDSPSAVYKVTCEYLYTFPEDNDGRCKIFGLKGPSKKVLAFLKKEAATKKGQLFKLPIEGIKQIANGYFFPVHTEEIDRLNIQLEMKIKIS